MPWSFGIGALFLFTKIVEYCKKICYYKKSCRTSSRKEVILMDNIVALILVPVAVNVISYCIYKWLDRKDK